MERLISDCCYFGMYHVFYVYTTNLSRLSCGIQARLFSKKHTIIDNATLILGLKSKD